jgi:glycerol-3-phosphate dehydrogenase
LKKIYDFLVIGAGVIGNAVARELSRCKLTAAVLEKEPDLCFETSGRNSGVLHAGFNNKKGSKMAKFCVEGNLGFDKIAQELNVPFRRTGKLVVGFTEEDMEKLLAMKALGEENGVLGLEIIDKSKIKELAPYVEGEFAMYSPMTGILNPFELTIALAENAHQNGVDYFFSSKVNKITRENNIYTLFTDSGEYKSRWIINCAGLNSDKVSSMLGIEGYTIYPCRGEYFILDKKAGDYLPLPAYPVPNLKEGGLGIHLTPTVEGNVLIGPSTEYLDENDNYASTKRIMDLLIKDGGRIFPYIKKEYFIRNFCGIRPKLTSADKGGYADFVIERRDEAPNTINLVGIESPGLTASTPIAREVIRLINEIEPLTENPCFNPNRKRDKPFCALSLDEQKRKIEQNPDYGEIVCRCEQITKAEILQAIHNPLCSSTLTGIKYRCGAMMGRCQGGYCETRITELIEQETGKKCTDILYGRKGSKLFLGEVRK